MSTYFQLSILLALGVVANAGVTGYYGGAYGGAIAAPAFAAPAYRANVAVAAAPAFAAPAFRAPLAVAHAAPVVAHAAPLAVAHAAPVAKVLAAEVHAPQPYEFGYNRQHEDGAVVHRHETSDGVNQQGSYGYTGPDGIYRQVNYIADAAGYRATIETNEPGTANQNPAAVSIAAAEPPYKVLPAAAPVAVAHAAPIVKAAVHAPVAVAHAAPVLRAAPAFAHAAYAAPAYGHAAYAAPAFGHAAYAAPAAVVKGHHYGYAY